MVGFAAETNAVEHYARAKLLAKNLDLIAANEVGHAKAFDCDENALLVLWRGGRVELPVSSKRELARALTGVIIEQYFDQLAARERDGTGAARSRAACDARGRSGILVPWMIPAAGRCRSGSSMRAWGPSFRCRSTPRSAPRASTCAPASTRRSRSSPGRAELIPTGLAIHLADPQLAARDPAALGARP